ncbi:MAG: hypothetical protein HS117_10255 [Verrucomicrobiaceae bacterium]|nr:hypothetical protein [Verrucomicrobiaceae bacterium]
MKTLSCPVLWTVLVVSLHTVSLAQQPLSPEERLARLEQQAAALLAEIQQFRKDMKPAGGTRGAAESPAAPEMQPGVLAHVYVRTGGANTFSPPPPKATPSDTRVNAGNVFDSRTQAKASGYDGQPATIVWEGFFKVEEAGIYEFMLESRTAVVNIGPKTLSSKGEKSVRLDLKPGYWPVKIMDGIRSGHASYDVLLRVKQSGLDPILLTPGSLWTPKND